MTDGSRSAAELEAEARAMRSSRAPPLNRQAAPAAATDLGFATDAVRPDPPARRSGYFTDFHMNELLMRPTYSEQ